MKYAYLYMAILVLVIALGCSKGPETPSQTTEPSSQDSAMIDDESDAEETSAESSEPASYDLSSEEAEKAVDFEQGKKTRISTPYKIIQVGDTYVFGVGIKNVMPREQRFRLKVHFKEAKTTGGLATLIDVADDDTMLSWMGNNRFTTVELGPGESTAEPLIVEVKPTIGPGESTIPGSYVFDVLIEYESSPRFWDSYEENILTIKVKE
ncbi:hypothetical protein GF345_05565 [Candidatus Woesearchaeota archaeon]|nr:hypothetical protein [Candidatus Woesearchaeota archaeon]